MKYGFMPRAMWLLFHNSFEKALETELHQKNGKEIMRKAHKHYKEILADVDEFDSRDRFLVNNFVIEDGATPTDYTATFSACGICCLMKKLGIEEVTPAMCRYDYDMAQMSGTVFTRKFTLASGGSCCDCHYHHIQ